MQRVKAPASGFGPCSELGAREAGGGGIGAWMVASKGPYIDFCSFKSQRSYKHVLQHMQVEEVFEGKKQIQPLLVPPSVTNEKCYERMTELYI